jgi:hypothetical protein
MELYVKHVFLLIVLLAIHGCSLNQLFLTDEIDKITIVKHTSWIKHNRTYFTRANLKVLRNGTPYLLFLNQQKQDLGVLLHRGNTYIFYHFFAPSKKPFLLHGSRKHVFSFLYRHGYHILETPESAGYAVRTGPRRYKGVKTYLIDITDYSKLKKRYEKAIRTYHSKMISDIRESLPKRMIEPYLRYYWQRAKSETQKKALKRIAKKLHIVFEQPDIPVPVSISEQTPYHYYRYRASMYELGNYLQSVESRAALTPAQYTLLQHRLQTLQKEKLLEEGSLETLIAAYEKNHDPRFKQRILELLKNQHAK